MFTLKWKITLLVMAAAIFGLQFKQAVFPPCCDQEPIILVDTVLVPGPPVISQVPVPFEVTREVPGPPVIKEVPVPFEVTREVEVPVEKLVDKPCVAHAYVAMQHYVKKHFPGMQVLFDDLYDYGLEKPYTYTIISYIAVLEESTFCCTDWYMITAEIKYEGGPPCESSSWNVSYTFVEE